MGMVVAVCMSESKGTRKHEVSEARVLENHGLEGDAHAGSWHRQVSLLALEAIEDFQRRGALVRYGDFGENLVISHINPATLPVGTRLRTGDVVLEISQIGKECHTRCAIYHAMGECIMPVQGVFAKVLHGGIIKSGDAIDLEDASSQQP